jgi:urease accessory protein
VLSLSKHLHRKTIDPSAHRRNSPIHITAPKTAPGSCRCGTLHATLANDPAILNSPAPIPSISHQHGWQASLELRIERRDERSVLAHRLHRGPLRVQKALYPEGDEVCQILMLHPPAGIAGGDRLRISVEVASGAHAQLTTPGAGKWYRSLGPLATQHIALNVEAGGLLEWLPQEAIVFDKANAEARTEITLAQGARAIGWDLVCLGRKASGERFEQGRYVQHYRLQRPDGTPLWRESLRLDGSDPAIAAAVGLQGHTVFGNLWCAGLAPDPELLEALRAIRITDGLCGVSALPDVTIVRAVSHSAEAARQALEQAWAIMRPRVAGRPAVTPRIWRT